MTANPRIVNQPNGPYVLGAGNDPDIFAVIVVDQAGNLPGDTGYTGIGGSGGGSGGGPATLASGAVSLTVGATGTVIMMGDLVYGVGPNLAALTLPINNGVSTSTIDTTVAQVVDCTVTWSTNAAGNSISALTASLEALN